MTAWTIATAAAVLILAALWRGPLWRPRRLPGVTRPRPWGVGHRGARDVREENTLAAFQLAFAHLDGIETDVQRTRDGELVLWHDFDCGGRPVDACTLAELRAAAPSLLRLDDLFELARQHPGTLLNLEVKSRPAPARRWRLERALTRSVRRAGVADRTWVSSFDPLALLRVRLLAPRLRTALLYGGGAPRWTAALAGWLHVDALHPHASLVDDALLGRAAERRLPVHTWTVNDPGRVRALCRAGVGAVIGDDPEALARQLREAGAAR